MMLRPVEYEYLVRPFWSEGRFMLTRVLHEMVVNKAVTIANANKIVHRKERPRVRPFVALGPVKIESPELYEQFFLNILTQHGSMWVTELVLRSHSRLDLDTDKFKTDYVEPVLKRKNYIRPFLGRTTEVKKTVAEIRTTLSEVEKHAKGEIDPMFLVEKLNMLGINFILLDAETRKIIGKELPAFLIDFKGQFSFGDTMWMNYALFSSSFGDTSFDSGFGDHSFDGFDGGDFGGGGGGDNW